MLNPITLRIFINRACIIITVIWSGITYISKIYKATTLEFIGNDEEMCLVTYMYLQPHCAVLPDVKDCFELKNKDVWSSINNIIISE